MSASVDAILLLYLFIYCEFDHIYSVVADIVKARARTSSVPDGIAQWNAREIERHSAYRRREYNFSLIFFRYHFVIFFI